MENYKNSKIGRESAKKYGDILEMERPQTEESLHKHPRMTLQNRAKIFSAMLHATPRATLSFSSPFNG